MILNNIRALMPDGAFHVRSFEFGGGVITRISDAPLPDGHDASGLTLAPGFIDAHIHGFMGVDVMEGAQALNSMSVNLPKHGVTTFLPTTMSAPDLETYRALRAVKEVMQDAPGARIAGAHIEGRFLNPVRAGAQDPAVAAPPTSDIFSAMVGDCIEVVRMLTIAPELPGAEALIRTLSQRGIRISCGHSDADYETFMESLSWGVTQVTHLFNGMNPLHHRTPGVPGGALVSDAWVQIIADGIHLHPAALTLAYRVKGVKRALLITDAMMATGLGNGAYTLGGQRVYVEDGAARLKSGSLAGSTLTLDAAVRNMTRLSGVTPEDALMMATATPAASLGMQDRGALEAGRLADAVVLDGAMNVVSTIIGGRVIYGQGMEG